MLFISVPQQQHPAEVSGSAIVMKTGFRYLFLCACVQICECMCVCMTSTHV